MELRNMLYKKIKRNKFFITAGTGVAGFFLLKTFPFSLFSKKDVINKKEVKVKLNPHAVSRQKTGDGNVR
jgi:hypothetical protein